MGFAAAVRACLSSYATFSGRARRPEFWWLALAHLMSLAALFHFKPGLLGLLAWLATVTPMLAVSWRRLHDVGRSGLWTLAVPGICAPLAFVFALALFSGMGLRPVGMPAAVWWSEAMTRVAASFGVLGLVALFAVFLVVPLALWMVALGHLIEPTQPGPNRFGPEPPA